MSPGTKFSWQYGLQQQLIWNLVAEAVATNWLWEGKKPGQGWGPPRCFHLCVRPFKPLCTDQLMTENFLQWETSGVRAFNLVSRIPQWTGSWR